MSVSLVQHASNRPLAWFGQGSRPTGNAQHLSEIVSRIVAISVQAETATCSELAGNCLKIPAKSDRIEGFRSCEKIGLNYLFLLYKFGGEGEITRTARSHCGPPPILGDVLRHGYAAPCRTGRVLIKSARPSKLKRPLRGAFSIWRRGSQSTGDLRSSTEVLELD